MKKLAAMISATMLFSSLSVGSVFAFTDVTGDQSIAISALQDRGIVNGVDAEHFAPKGQISYAQSVQMIVKAFDYNLDLMKFAEQPVASTLFTNVRDNAWYAEAFVIAHYNGLNIPKDVNPNAALTREQFADLLDHALEKKANLPMINLKMEIKDDSQITPGLQGSILRLVHYKIAELDKDGNFNPKSELTRGESATWLYNAIRFVEERQAPVTTDQETIQALTNEINMLKSESTAQQIMESNYGTSTQVTNVVKVTDTEFQVEAAPVSFEGNFKGLFTEGKSYPYYSDAAMGGQRGVIIKDNYGVWHSFGYKEPIS